MNKVIVDTTHSLLTEMRGALGTWHVTCLNRDNIILIKRPSDKSAQFTITEMNGRQWRILAELIKEED